MRALVFDRTQGWSAASRVGTKRSIGSVRCPNPLTRSKWGWLFVDGDALSTNSLRTRATQFEAIRERLAPDALLWFRTCETFGARTGQDFAERISEYFGARVAGHTHIIGFHQSGLHGLRPGELPHWSTTEGLRAGSAERPVRAHGSAPWRTRTITALSGNVPAAWFER